ncbi:hypothetical protein [Homoserinibacter sp. YIM 151385]|uniref:hypothetical protein n=1 Tax=Homoserinibacter sp. YIM 151385 TaxID=2985506 RepID=UPI0022F0CBF7|nr:hypothetical protein [Homoserinibacter sp. YIM 151385]WBU37743.1 hypothetical protein OF852_12615 [Homoserinibacter sp. YIM 151385]
MPRLAPRAAIALLAAAALLSAPVAVAPAAAAPASQLAGVALERSDNMIYPIRDGYDDTVVLTFAGFADTGELVDEAVEGTLRVRLGSRTVASWPIRSSARAEFRWGGRVGGVTKAGTFIATASITNADGDVLQDSTSVKVSTKRLVKKTTTQRVSALASLRRCTDIEDDFTARCFEVLFPRNSGGINYSGGRGGSGSWATRAVHGLALPAAVRSSVVPAKFRVSSSMEIEGGTAIAACRASRSLSGCGDSGTGSMRTTSGTLSSPTVTLSPRSTRLNWAVLLRGKADAMATSYTITTTTYSLR